MKEFGGHFRSLKSDFDYENLKKILETETLSERVNTIKAAKKETLNDVLKIFNNNKKLEMIRSDYYDYLTDSFIVFGFIEVTTFNNIYEKYGKHQSQERYFGEDEKYKKQEQELIRRIEENLITKVDFDESKSKKYCVVVLMEYGDKYLLKKVYNDLFAYLTLNINPESYGLTSIDAFKQVTNRDVYNDVGIIVNNDEVTIISVSDRYINISNINRIHFLQPVLIKNIRKNDRNDSKGFHLIDYQELETLIKIMNDDFDFNWFYCKPESRVLNSVLSFYTINNNKYGIFDYCFELKDGYADNIKSLEYKLKNFCEQIEAASKNISVCNLIDYDIMGEGYLLEISDKSNVTPINDLFNESNDKFYSSTVNNEIQICEEDYFHFYKNRILWFNPSHNKCSHLFPLCGADTLMVWDDEDKENDFPTLYSKYQILLLNIIKKEVLSEIDTSLVDEINNISINVNENSKDTGDILVTAYNQHLDIMMLSNQNNELNSLYPTAMDEIDKKMHIDKLENDYEKYSNALNVITDTKSKISDNKLADMLNTIQIASIVLTVLGWILVVFQGQIYITLIVAFSILSVVLAIIIKNIISKK